MMNQEKIQELVSRSQQDDKRAFALLVSEFQPLVFRLAFRLLCDEEEARDITQETFRKTACQPGFTKSPVTPVTTVCVRYAILRWIMNPPFPIR